MTTADSHPLLSFDTPVIGTRHKPKPNMPPQVHKPSPDRQGERIAPQFLHLRNAFENQRAVLSSGPADEIDPELVVVFDLAGTVDGFRSAAETAGLQFLTEQLEDESEPDDDFYIVDRDTDGASGDGVAHSLYVVMSNATAIDQLIRLFDTWQDDQAATFDRGLNKFKNVFAQLRAIRRWSAVDRIKDTGLLDRWNEHLAVVGGSISPQIVEIELWYLRTVAARAAADTALREIIAQAGGRVLADAQIAAIAYHALLVELPVQQVQRVIDRGAESIRLLDAEQIMFVSPYTPMSIRQEHSQPIDQVAVTPGPLPTEKQPRVALLDGLPVANHDFLSDRLIIDDPDGVGDTAYPVSMRRHGTTMASLIIHGDLSAPGTPIDRPLYCRPILQADEFRRTEHFVTEALLPDLLHRAIRRMMEDDGTHEATARSVRIINLSIGSASRALVRRISPTARLLDWLAVKYNLLFIVSAGNHIDTPLAVPTSSIADTDEVKNAALKAAWSTSLRRGIMPPGDALNVLTVGATHADAAETTVPDTVWDITSEHAPALYGAVGPGVNRSVKPEVHHAGGRSLYVRPVDSGSRTTDLVLAPATVHGPGLLAAAPPTLGRTDTLDYTHGTSNATALVTREADRIFDILEAASESDSSFPDGRFHPVLARALLVHACSWSGQGEHIADVLGFDRYNKRGRLTALLGYGRLHPDRIATGVGNRAVVVAGSAIGRDERHTYHLPLPISLQSKAEWHRITVTLASMTPTIGRLRRYRSAKVFFRPLDQDMSAVGKRTEGEPHAVRRGTCQHEIFESSRSLSFVQGGTVPVHVECQNDALSLTKSDRVRYALVVSVETAASVSTTINQEVRAALRARTRERVSNRLRTR